jgi:phosphohistidine phosphatase
MQLYLMRHAIAHELGADGSRTDAGRTLTTEGRANTRAAAQAMRRLELDFDAIWTSPLVRARQTAEIVAEVLKKNHCLQEVPELAPGASPERIVKALARLDHGSSVLLVGHEPDLSRLVAFLVWGSLEADRLDFKKGALCRLDGEFGLGGGKATLRWFLAPKQLRLLAAT